MSPFQPLRFIGTRWLLWRHTTPLQHISDVFMNELYLKMHKIKQINTTLYTEWEYQY